MDRLFVAAAGGAAIAFRSSQRILVSGYRGPALTPAATLIATKRRSVRSGPSAPVIVHRTVVLTPSKDNTLFESADGSLSNGAGPHLFTGRTATNARRRTLLAFNVTSQIPPGSTVTRVALRLGVSTARSNTPPVLHRLTADWGEGTSDAGFSRDGTGTQARTNDATWLHTFFPNTRWTTAGGDFETAADATATPGSFEDNWSSPAMIARVQQWLDQPATNFGWIVIGDESRSTTAKRYDSREADSTANRPALTVEFDTRQ
jgi:hypothetical protein